MRLHRMLPIALIALGGLSLGSGCPTVPKLEDRVIELAIGGSTTLDPFNSKSTVSLHYNTPGTYNLVTDINLNKLLDDAGIDRKNPTITYCQGGIRAAHAAFALELMGYEDVRVYDGSMQDWANRDDTPLVK